MSTTRRSTIQSRTHGRGPRRDVRAHSPLVAGVVSRLGSDVAHSGMKTTHATSDQRVDSELGQADAVTDQEPCSMEEAVGYAKLPCEHEMPVADAIALKHDRVFRLIDRSGNIAPAGRGSLGLFEDDTRILSHYELRGAGSPPVRLSAQVVQPFTARIDLAVNDHAFGGHTWDPKHAIHIEREFIVDDG